jgi:hypothetical protein
MVALRARRRSLHWKLSLSILPSPAPQLFQTPLRTSRQSYDDLRFAYLRSPDGGYPADISVPPSRSGSGRRDPSSQADASSGPASNGVFDPLSLEDESPWKKYYKDLEVKKEIRKDVERTQVDPCMSLAPGEPLSTDRRLPFAASPTCPTSRPTMPGSCSRQFSSCTARCTQTSRTVRCVRRESIVASYPPNLTRPPPVPIRRSGHARARCCHAARS